MINKVIQHQTNEQRNNENSQELKLSQKGGKIEDNQVIQRKELHQKKTFDWHKFY